MADETPSTAGLTMDRGLALGNSAGTAGRRRLHVLVDQLGAPIPVEFEPSGTPVHQQFFGDTTPGVEQSLLTFTVGASLQRTLRRAVVVCRTPGLWHLDIDGTTWASGRTGAGREESIFEWLPGYPVQAGAVGTLKFTAKAGFPAAALEAYLMADEKTV